MAVQTRITTSQGGHRVHITVNGNQFDTPPLEHLLFYAVLAGLVEAELVELPIAVALGVGHAIMDLTRRPGLVAIGEALEET